MIRVGLMVLAMAKRGLLCIENRFRWYLFVVVEVKYCKVPEMQIFGEQRTSHMFALLAYPELSCCVVKSASKATQSHRVVQL